MKKYFFIFNKNHSGQKQLNGIIEILYQKMKEILIIGDFGDTNNKSLDLPKKNRKVFFASFSKLI